MAEFHRKIELQSPDDLQYLISNVRRAAHEKIDRDLPPIEGEDRMRRHVEDLVQDVLLTPVGKSERARTPRGGSHRGDCGAEEKDARRGSGKR
ncbi:hypothetical protein OIDMADRAFT_122451 [Oidiodendron maius Zn]|uniref:Uncharacterized protein n=1 Tax=Oidiodendron maius (strain Zn) TaxID=913774 RepID=A0A0C3HC93_OIDMZ|nr:hypothetical protein OIDMADRAFT_122451 [Oidiodendron maius Zn]